MGSITRKHPICKKIIIWMLRSSTKCFLNSEPYCKIDEIKDRINKEMLKYE